MSIGNFMTLFQVSSRSMRLAAPLRKRTRRFPYLRIVGSMLIGGVLIILLVNTGTNTVFLLLPIIISLTWPQPQRYNISKLFHSTPLYLLFTICLTCIYYGAITEGQLFVHQGLDEPHIVIITTVLAWEIMLEPLRAYLQSLVERRFNIRNREAAKAIKAFTATLREEIDLEQLCERFLTVIEQTMQPSAASIWIHMSREQQQELAGSTEEICVADDDALFAYMLSHPGTLEIERLQLDSLLMWDMKLRKAEMLLPLSSQGELLGLLILGPHMKGEAYTREERAMLDTLAPQIAPTLRVAQIVREQQMQVRERERIAQELRTAQDIQQTFLPKDIPAFPGWEITPYYQPAREVGGDFYDFHPFADGRLGLVIGDVTDKGIPAALVMTATRTMLRVAAQEKTSPREVLARVNDLLYVDIPSGMFVTCFYAILDPTSGRLCYANAGHELPYRQHSGGSEELWATGMPLGMMPGTSYEDYETTLMPGESLLFYSDGLVEAHNPAREMFGFPRLKAVLEASADGTSLIDVLLDKLKCFTGEGWEQEDDVTLVTLQRTPESFAMNKHLVPPHLLL